MSRDGPEKVATIFKLRKKGVEFALKARREARQQEGNSGWKGKLAIAPEGFRVETNGCKQIGRREVVYKSYQNSQKFRCPLKYPL